MLSSAPNSPQRQQEPISHESPVHSKMLHSSHAYQSDSLEDVRTTEILEYLGPRIPEVKFEDFMDYLAPPMPTFDLDAIMRLLRSGPQPVLTDSGHWKAFEKEPKEQDGEEDAIFQPIPSIFDAVVEAIIADPNSNLTANSRSIDFVQNPNMTPISFEREKLSHPDGCMLLKSRRGEGIQWADIVLSCEYKVKDGDKQLDDDVRKCIWSMQHVMRDDPCRRATFGLTIENTTARIWFCCRSAVVVSDAFNFIQKPEALVRLFAAFAFADRKSLGYDPTMERTSGMPPQLVVAVHSDKDIEKERKFKIIKTLSSYGAETLRGRGTRVFEAIEVDSSGREKGDNVVLKDVWIDSDRMREGAILDALYNGAGDEDKLLVRHHFVTPVCHGDVLLAESNIVDDTEYGLMRGLDSELDYTKFFFLQRNGFAVTTYRSSSGSEQLAPASRLVYIPYSVPKYAHKTHYRVVFKEKGITIDSIKTLPEVLRILSGIVTALQLLRRLGWVHRDVSIGNILSCNGQAKLSDFEFARKVGDEKSHEKRTGTVEFMSVEAASQKYLFPPPGRTLIPFSQQLRQLTQPEKGPETVNRPGSYKVPWSHNHLHDLESLWWVAVWIVFFYEFSKPGQPDAESHSHLQTAEGQLTLAHSIFPLVFDSITREHTFRLDFAFKHTCTKLSLNKKVMCNYLEVARQELLFHYRSVESSLPHSVNPEVSDDEIYDNFRLIFDTAHQDSIHSDVILKSIQDIVYTELLKKSKSN